ncbi:hypothetical protein I4U23_017068 [Adineta vaga]|nr:hypothetical protein I4U23_017068 [Adineta vaga]
MGSESFSINRSLNGTIAAGTGLSGGVINQLNVPSEVFVDSASNIYISDTYNHRVMLWRKNSSNGIVVAGISSNVGCSASLLNYPFGLAIDSLQNIYIADCYNHRVMKWAPNATSGTYVAGSCTPGSNSQLLNYPTAGITGSTSTSLTLLNQPSRAILDPNETNVYVNDMMNNRVLRFTLI